MRPALFLLTLLWSAVLAAAPLALKPVPVAERVYAVFGDLGNQTYENDGLNANLGFVIGEDSVLVINTGPSRRVAEALHAAIRNVTTKPVKWVVNVNSQNHYWHGNDYFREQGATLIAQAEAVRLMRELGPDQLESNRAVLKDKAAGTVLAPATVGFADRKTLDLGNLQVELLHHGNAHTPGDLAVWIPARKTLFTGDIALNERMISILPTGSTAGWIKAFDELAKLPATIWVPGHGRVTNPERARHDTRDYLVFLRDAARKIFDAGGSLQDAVEKVDQSRFRSLANYELLAARNMNIVFQEIEKEAF